MINKSTVNFSNQISILKQKLETADAILIGAGAGFSASAGYTYDGNRFLDNFLDFRDKYGITDIYSGGFYPFDSLEEYWAWWSRQIYLNRYDREKSEVYTNLYKLVKNKNYFVLTTNVDHLFQDNGFDTQKLFYTQGDYGLWQCSKPCHDKTYDNEKTVRKMVATQKNMKVLSELIPKCSLCDSPMTMNLRIDNNFVQDEGWYSACDRYQKFIKKQSHSRVLLIELGVGENTPSIIRYPFYQIVTENSEATYAVLNLNKSGYPKMVQDRSILINEDIGTILKRLI